jgi:hypothetical protein
MVSLQPSSKLQNALTHTTQDLNAVSSVQSQYVFKITIKIIEVIQRHVLWRFLNEFIMM